MNAAPIKGLTLRQGDREVNVHDVIDGVVYYGFYRLDSDCPAGLYRVSLQEWDAMLKVALDAGAGMYCLLAAPACS